jgi:hypothetical protein
MMTSHGSRSRPACPQSRADPAPSRYASLLRESEPRICRPRSLPVRTSSSHRRLGPRNSTSPLRAAESDRSATPTGHPRCKHPSRPMRKCPPSLVARALLSTSTTLEASSSSSRSAPEEKSASGVAVAAATTSVSNSSGSSFARRSSSGGRAPALLARSAREPEPASAATGPSGSRRHRACGSRLGRNRAVRSGRRHSSATRLPVSSRGAG